MRYKVTMSCENGHSHSITFEGESRDWVESWAGLMDGTSPFYKFSPIGTDSIIGKCGICRAQLRSVVESVAP